MNHLKFKIWRCCILLLAFAGAMPSLAQNYPVDGTFLLRSKQPQIHDQLRRHNSLESLASHTLRLSQPGLTNLQPGLSRIGFQVYNFATNNHEYREGLLVSQGRHCHLFVETSAVERFKKASGDLFAAIVDTFDDVVYPTVTSWYGQPVIPHWMRLPDDRVYIFLVDIRDNFGDGYVAGYFDHRDLNGLWGNQKPVFFMDISPGEPGDPNDKLNPFYRTLAHEFQHMVNFSNKLANHAAAEERWLDEGMAMYAEYLFSGRVGADSRRLPPMPHFDRFLEAPSVNLLSNSRSSWFREDYLFRQYGASFMFVYYIIQRFGGNSEVQKQGFLRRFASAAKSGAAGLNQIFADYNTTFKKVFAEFVLALHLDDVNLDDGQFSLTGTGQPFGYDVDSLPLRMNLHHYRGENNSFIGGRGSILPNSFKAEEFVGSGTANLRMSFSPGMTPFWASIKNDGSVALRQLDLDSSGKAAIAVDFDQISRAVMLPLAISEQFDDQTIMGYSFSSQKQNLVLYPMPNPAFPEQLIIFLGSDKALDDDPKLTIRFNNLVESPRMTPVNEENTLFAAHYQISASGEGQATCVIGEEHCSFSFSAATLLDIARSGITLGAVRLKPEVPAEGRLLLIAQPEFYQHPLVGEVVAGPWDIVVEAGLSASLVVAQPDFPIARTGLARAHQEGKLGEWQSLTAEYAAVRGSVSDSGRYYMVRDDMTPEVLHFAASASGHGNVQISYALTDDLSGIDYGNSSLVILSAGNEKILPLSETGSINLELPESGAYELRLDAIDRAGNAASRSLRFQVSKNAVLANSNVYPSPARNNARIVLQFDKAADFDVANMKIYDSSGALVAEPELIKAGPARLVANWNLSGRSGQRVGNGVYFYLARMQNGPEKIQARGKIAVLR